MTGLAQDLSNRDIAEQINGYERSFASGYLRYMNTRDYTSERSRLKLEGDAEDFFEGVKKVLLPDETNTEIYQPSDKQQSRTQGSGSGSSKVDSTFLTVLEELKSIFNV